MRVPDINASGRFVLKQPFIAFPDVIYNVTALREFNDLYYHGLDPYEMFYEKYGLTNGVEVDGVEFDFQEEINKNPVIVTLEGNDGSTIFVPNTFIESFPNATDVKYSRVIVSADLGSIPDVVNLDLLQKEIKEIVDARAGIKSEVKLHKGPSDRQPTPEEHDVLEASRIGSMKHIKSLYANNLQLQKQIEEQRLHIQTLLSILRENRLL